MYQRFSIFLLMSFGFSFCTPTQNHVLRNPVPNAILRIDMNLSAFGVESDGFPSIEAHLDFQHDSSSCTKSFYNPAYKGSTYRLSRTEMQKILNFLQDVNFKELKKEYTVGPHRPAYFNNNDIHN